MKLWWWLLSFWSRPNIESCHPSLQCEQRGHEFPVGRLDGCKTQHVKEAAGCDPNWRVGHCDPAVHKLRKARLQSGKDAEHFVADGLVVVSWEEQSSLVHLLTMRLEGGMEKAVLQEHLVASLQGDRLILIHLKSKQAATVRLPSQTCSGKPWQNASNPWRRLWCAWVCHRLCWTGGPTQPSHQPARWQNKTSSEHEKSGDDWWWVFFFIIKFRGNFLLFVLDSFGCANEFQPLRTIHGARNLKT